jgi:lipopolysaccharide export system permease protein
LVRVVIARRYINRELVALFVVTMIVLFVVAVGGRFIGYLQDAAVGKYTADALLSILGFRLPGFIQLLIPFCAYLAVLLTFGRLYADQEMSVLQGAGTSARRVLGWMMMPMLAVFAAEAWLTLYQTPANNQAFMDFMVEQRTRQEFETVNPGVFSVFSRGSRVTYAERLSPDRQTLYNVFIFESGEDQPTITIWAERGEQHVDEHTGSRFLLLFDGRRYEGRVGEQNYRIVEFEELGQRVLIDDVVRGGAQPSALPTGALFAGATAEEVAELHWRIGLPIFTVIGMVLAAGQARVKPRQGRFARTVPGILVLMAYYFVLLVNQNALAEGDWPAGLGFWLTHAVFLALALWGLARVERPART